MPARSGKPVLARDQVLVFAVLAGMAALHIRDRLRRGLVAPAAAVSGVVPPEMAVGFGDRVLVIIASARVLSAAVGRSGVIGRAIRCPKPRLRTAGARAAALTTSAMVPPAFM